MMAGSDPARSGKPGALSRLAGIAGSLGAAAVLERIGKLRYGNGYTRVLGYHATPEAARASFRRQLAFLGGRYRCFACGDIGAFLNGARDGTAPGLIISFDDGLLDNYLVAAPLLEEAGMRGWFFVPSTLPALGDTEQAGYCADNALNVPAVPAVPCVRIAMNWDELRDLRDRGHLIGCHTASHYRFRGTVDTELANREIRDAKMQMERELRVAVDGFAWVGGEPDTYSSAAEAAILAAGFRYAFTTQSLPFRPGDDPLRVHRTVVDADMDFGLFRLKLAGLSDFAHLGGRAETLRRLRMPATP